MYFSLIRSLQTNYEADNAFLCKTFNDDIDCLINWRKFTTRINFCAAFYYRGANIKRKAKLHFKYQSSEFNYTRCTRHQSLVNMKLLQVFIFTIICGLAVADYTDKECTFDCTSFKEPRTHVPICAEPVNAAYVKHGYKHFDHPCFLQKYNCDHKGDGEFYWIEVLSEKFQEFFFHRIPKSQIRFLPPNSQRNSWMSNIFTGRQLNYTLSG